MIRALENVLTWIKYEGNHFWSTKVFGGFFHWISLDDSTPEDPMKFTKNLFSIHFQAWLFSESGSKVVWGEHIVDQKWVSTRDFIFKELSPEQITRKGSLFLRIPEGGQLCHG